MKLLKSILHSCLDNQNNNNSILLLFSLGILLLTSCARSTYIHSVTNVPLMKEKNEFQVSGYVGLNHFEIQTAYSLPANIALMGNLLAVILIRFMSLVQGIIGLLRTVH